MHDRSVSFSQSVTAATTRLHRGALDARLAAGTDPQTTPELALRARQLTDLSTRRAIGRDVLAVIDRAHPRTEAISSAIPAAGAAIEETAPALTQLAVALRSPEPVCPWGVAKVLVLLRDGGGPLYAPDGDALYVAARDALLAMRPCAAAAVESVER
jgi:hypothetical protein